MQQEPNATIRWTRRGVLAAAGTLAATAMAERAGAAGCAGAGPLPDFEYIHTRPGGIANMPFQTTSLWRAASGEFQRAVVRSDGALISLTEGLLGWSLLPAGQVPPVPPQPAPAQPPMLSDGAPPSAVIAAVVGGVYAANEYRGADLEQPDIAAILAALGGSDGQGAPDSGRLHLRLEPLRADAPSYLTADIDLDAAADCGGGCDVAALLAAAPGRLVPVPDGCARAVAGVEMTAGKQAVAKLGGVLFLLGGFG